MKGLSAPVLARMLEVRAAIMAETSLARIMQVLTDAALVAERLIAEADAAMYAEKRRRVSARGTG